MLTPFLCEFLHEWDEHGGLKNGAGMGGLDCQSPTKICFKVCPNSARQTSLFVVDSWARTEDRTLA